MMDRLSSGASAGDKPLEEENRRLKKPMADPDGDAEHALKKALMPDTRGEREEKPADEGMR